MSTLTTSSTKLTTGLVRFSFLHIFEPDDFGGTGEPKYSASLIISKNDKKTVKAIQDAIAAATEQGKNSKFNGKTASLKNPLRDGDEERPDDEAYENSYFINAKSSKKPGVVDAQLSPIIDPQELYSGCYGHASLSFYPYNTNGNKGIGVILNGLMKKKDGEPLGATTNLDEDFADFVEM